MILYFLRKKLHIVMMAVSLLLLAGCSFGKAEEVHYISTVLPTFAVEATVAPSATPLPTITPKPETTKAPTLTPTPIPEVLSVYDQISAWEASNEADSAIPVKSALLVNLSKEKVVYSNHAL